MINKDGKTVAPTSETFQAAAANADWNSVPGYGVILTDQPGAQSWPMTAATFILIHKQPQDPAAAGEALKFFAWAYAKGGKMAEELDYRPDAHRGRRHRREDVGRQHQGRRRQAAVCELSATDREEGAAGAFRQQLPHRIPPRVQLSRCAAAGIDCDVPLRPGAPAGVGSPDASRSALPSRADRESGRCTNPGGTPVVDLALSSGTAASSDRRGDRARRSSAGCG